MLADQTEWRYRSFPFALINGRCRFSGRETRIRKTSQLPVKSDCHSIPFLSLSELPQPVFFLCTPPWSLNWHHRSCFLLVNPRARSPGSTLPRGLHRVRLVKAMVFPVVMYLTSVRVGLWRRLSTKELMLLNCGVGEDSWESLGLQGDPTSPFWRRSALGFLWKEWC